MKILDRLQPLGLFILRVVLGVIMLGHVLPRLNGGIHQFEEVVRNTGLPWWMAFVSIAAELFGGLALILGFWTRFFAFALTIDMAVAIAKVHWKNGMFPEHGYQFPLALAAIACSLVFFGSGPLSLDALRRGGGGGTARSSKKAS